MPLVPGDPTLSRLDTAYTALCNLETSKLIHIHKQVWQYLALSWAENDSTSAENFSFCAPVHTWWLRMFHNKYQQAVAFRLRAANCWNSATTTHRSFTHELTKHPINLGTLKYYTFTDTVVCLLRAPYKYFANVVHIWFMHYCMWPRQPHPHGRLTHFPFIYRPSD